jgi:tetratricopeptide (TPR) repeat protein
MDHPCTDARGLPLSTDRPDAAEAFDGFVRAVLGHRADAAARMAAVLEADPGMPLAHAARGACAMLLGRRETGAAAADALAAARGALAARDGTARERAHADALASLTVGAWTGAADAYDRILAAHPTDALALKLSHAVRFIVGDAPGMRRTVETALPAWDEGTPDRGYVLGCHAFALEETGDYAAAERAGRRAVEEAPDDAWGLHAVAHVFEMQGRWREGADWLADRPQAYAACNNFSFHIHWHRALFLLEDDRHAEVLELYDHAVRPHPTDDYRDIANAASLLVRLELAGVEAGRRWAELADIAAARIGDRCLVFADLHYLLALVGAGRMEHAVRLAEDMAARDVPGGGTQDMVARRVGAPIARAVIARAQGRAAEAAAALARVLPVLPAIGGSHAQRDVFEQICLAAAVEGGRREIAGPLLRARLDRRRADRFARRGLDLLAAGAAVAAA